MRIGHDCIGVGVGAMVFNQEGEVFLAQRGPKATNETGMWEFPGGQVEFGETLAEAIQREFIEEYGMHIEILELLSVSDHILAEENQHWVSPTFIAVHRDGTPQILEPEKCIAIGWFSLAELPEPLSIVSQDNMHSYHAKYGLQYAWTRSET